MSTLTRQQTWALIGLTIFWGMNWPMMKLSLQQITPLYFRAITMTLGALSLLAYVRWAEGSVWPTRRDWLTLALLMLPNILAWHTLSIFGVQELASGRAAVLGFTMPVFTVVLGSLFFGQAITRRTLVAGRRFDPKPDGTKGNPRPGGIALTADGKRRFVACMDRNAVAEID
ncbi:MAG: DMT family transporter, partial [Burkholderiaceae bacterium]